MIPAMSVILKGSWMKKDRCPEATITLNRTQYSSSYLFRVDVQSMCKESESERIQVRCTHSFDSLKNSWDTYWQRCKFLSWYNENLLSFCCFSLPILAKRSEKQCINFQLKLQWHTILNLRLQILFGKIFRMQTSNLVICLGELQWLLGEFRGRINEKRKY